MCLYYSETLCWKTSKISWVLRASFITIVQFENQCYSFAVFEVPIDSKKYICIKYVCKTKHFLRWKNNVHLYKCIYQIIKIKQYFIISTRLLWQDPVEATVSVCSREPRWILLWMFSNHDTQKLFTNNWKWL